MQQMSLQLFYNWEVGIRMHVFFGKTMPAVFTRPWSAVSTVKTIYKKQSLPDRSAEICLSQLGLRLGHQQRELFQFQVLNKYKTITLLILKRKRGNCRKSQYSNQSIFLPINIPTNQYSYQSIFQSINIPTNQWVAFSKTFRK